MNKITTSILVTITTLAFYLTLEFYTLNIEMKLKVILTASVAGISYFAYSKLIKAKIQKEKTSKKNKNIKT